MTSGNFAELSVVKRLLAIVAVLFLLVRPVCDAWAATHGHAGHVSAGLPAAHADHTGASRHAEFCCAKLQDGKLFLAGSVGPANAASDGFLFVAALGSYAVPQDFDQYGALRFSDAPLTRFSYYARSSRILR